MDSRRFLEAFAIWVLGGKGASASLGKLTWGFYIYIYIYNIYIYITYSVVYITYNI